MESLPTIGIVVISLVLWGGLVTAAFVAMETESGKQRAKIETAVRAFEWAVYVLACRRGLGFEPCRHVSDPAHGGKMLTPPRAAGVVGHFAVEVGGEGGSYSPCWRFVPQVPLRGWPVAGFGFQLRWPPVAGRPALAKLRAEGYRVYPRHNGLYVALPVSWSEPTWSEVLREIETDPARLERVFELALELVYSYPPWPARGQATTP
jgi:hypothetical protein